MTQDKRPIIETRRDQMFPVLGVVEIDRLRRFGGVQTHRSGDLLVRAGDEAQAFHVILSGEVIVAPHDDQLRNEPIVTYGPGGFVGELAQLSGRPALTDAIARSDVVAIAISPQRLHEAIVEEAELGERIMRALILRRVGLLERGVGGPIIIGRAESRDVLRLERFLARNGHPHQFLNPETDAFATGLISRLQPRASDLPIVLCPNGELLHNPSEAALARCIGLTRALDPTRAYDVAIVGAGPAGLATAVYAASEGLSVVVLDSRAFGGQAGGSPRIENYLGFPTGVSGMALMARAYTQAQKFGAEMAIPSEVLGLSLRDSSVGGGFELALQGNESACARAVVVASGAHYRRLDVEDLAAFEGSSVHYWASPAERRLCAGCEIAVVGAGNSAGQSAVYLADQAPRVWLVVRGKSLKRTMSSYLRDRIAAHPRIQVLFETEITGLEGTDGALEEVRWRHRQTNAEKRHPIRHLFLFIGAEPNTSWLSQSNIDVDAKGFLRAEPFARSSALPFETSLRGVFAVGDVRSGSVKRVAAAVGEGAQAVVALHAFLAGRTDPSKVVRPKDPEAA